MSDLYGGYAVDGKELGVVEVGLHVGFLNAALAGRLTIWGDPDSSPAMNREGMGVVATNTFDYADAMVREFRSRTPQMTAALYHLAMHEEDAFDLLESSKKTDRELHRLLDLILDAGNGPWTQAEISSITGHYEGCFYPLMKARVILTSNDYSPLPRKEDDDAP